jgi:hypothetical protein
MFMKVIRPLKWSLCLYTIENLEYTTDCSISLLLFHVGLAEPIIVMMRHRALLVGLLIGQLVKTFASEIDYNKLLFTCMSFVKYFISPLNISDI